jgi:hypothetical protein
VTRHQVDPRRLSDSDLARHLLTVRGVQWMNGERGMPLALVLRAQARDLVAVHAGLRGAPTLRQSDVDVWLTADHATAAVVLADRRLAVRDTTARRRKVFGLDAGTTPKHVLAVDDATLGLGHDECDALVPPSPVDFVPPTVRGEFDLMADYAYPGVLAALAGALGIAADERLAAAVAGTVPVLDALLCPPTLAATRRLVTAYDELRGLAPDPVALLTLAVGSHVAANLIGRSVLAALAHPGGHDPAPLVEETLRWDPPVRVASRIAAAEVTVAGQRVSAGDQVIVLVDAANRDPSVFADPDRFDPTRAGAPHLTLHDTPVRLLAPLVRRLAVTAVAALPPVSPAGPVVAHMRSPVAGALARVPCRG